MLKIKQKNWLAKKIPKQTQKEVKNFGTVIYKEFDKVSNPCELNSQFSGNSLEFLGILKNSQLCK